MSRKFNLERRVSEIESKNYKSFCITILNSLINYCCEAKGNEKSKKYLETLLKFVERVETLTSEDYKNCLFLLNGRLKEHGVTRGNYFANRISKLRDKALFLVETYDVINNQK